MTRRGHLQLFIHGSLFLIASYLCGLPAFFTFKPVLHPTTMDFWRQSHIILISTGVWTIAVGAVLPYLEMNEVLERILTWLMISSGWLFIFSLPIRLMSILSNLDIENGPYTRPYVGFLGANGLTALIAAGLVVRTAYLALHRMPPRIRQL